MRLRYEDVEYAVCSNPDCPKTGKEYEGATCPECMLASLRKVLHKRLILVDADPRPAPYAPVERFRCSRKDCGNLFDFPPEQGAARRARLWWPEDILEGWADALDTDLAALQSKLKAFEDALPTCRCPLCQAAPPERPTWVWVRTFGGPLDDGFALLWQAL